MCILLCSLSHCFPFVAPIRQSIKSNREKKRPVILSERSCTHERTEERSPQDESKWKAERLSPDWQPRVSEQPGREVSSSVCCRLTARVGGSEFSQGAVMLHESFGKRSLMGKAAVSWTHKQEIETRVVPLKNRHKGMPTDDWTVSTASCRTLSCTPAYTVRYISSRWQKLMRKPVTMKYLW